MRLVEVVVLMGAHCISPVEHTQTQMTTDAGKVQCAVVIEKDTEKRTLKVTPETMSGDPRVIAAIARFDAKAAATRIVPAFAPAGSPTTVIKPPPPLAADTTRPLPETAVQQQPAESETPPALASAGSETTTGNIETAGQDAVASAAQPAATPEAAKPATRKVVTLAQAEPAPKPARQPRAEKAKPEKKQVASAQDNAKTTSQCKGSAVPRWYKTADGHRKYRCVRPEPAGARPPSGSKPPAQLY